MALDDFLEPEVVVAVAVTAAVASPSVRKVLRRGLVYGIAGLLAAKDKATTIAQGVAREARQTAANGSAAAQANSPTPEVVPT